MSLIKSISVDSILYVEVSDRCYLTYPCLHDVVVNFKSGNQVKYKTLSGVIIRANFYEFLTESDKKHFDAYKNLIKDSHTLFDENGKLKK